MQKKSSSNNFVNSAKQILDGLYLTHLEEWHTIITNRLRRETKTTQTRALQVLGEAKSKILECVKTFATAQKEQNNQLLKETTEKIAIFQGIHDGIIAGLVRSGVMLREDRLAKSFRELNFDVQLQESADTAVGLLYEALDDWDKATVDRWKKGSNAFSNKLFGGPDKDKNTYQRKYFDFEPDVESPVKDELEAHFAKHGYTISNYRKGLVKDKIGRDVSIGRKLIQTKADPSLLKKYEGDKARQNKNQNDLKILISRHPHDVAGMTTKGQSWCGSSCMNFYTGTHREYLPQDVKHGTHIAYLVRQGDEGHPQKPIARIAIKKHVNTETGKHFALKPEGKVYGEAPGGFLKAVQDILDREHNVHLPTGAYEKHEAVYDDDGQTEYLHAGKDFEAGLAHPNPRIRAAAFKHKDIKPHHLDSVFDNPNSGAAIEEILDADHPALRPQHIEKGMNHPSALVRAKSIRHKYAHSDSLIQKGLSDESELVRSATLSNPNIQPHHLDVAIKDKDWKIASHALRHNQSQQRHFDYAAANFEGQHLAALAGDERIKPHHADKILDWLHSSTGPSSFIAHDKVAETLARNPALGEQGIDRLLQNHVFTKRHATNDFVESLTNHKNFGDRHVQSILDAYENDPERDRNGNTQSSNVERAYKHTLDARVKLKPHHIDRILKSDKFSVEDKGKWMPYQVHFNDKHIDYIFDKHFENPKQSNRLTPNWGNVYETAVQYSDKLQDRHVDRILDSQQDSYKQLPEQPLLRNRSLSSSHLHKIIDRQKDNQFIAADVALHDNSDASHIDKLMDHPSVNVQRELGNHKHLRPDQHEILFSKATYPGIKRSLVFHKLSDSRHLHHIFDEANDPQPTGDPTVDSAFKRQMRELRRDVLLRHPKTASEHVDTIFKGDDPSLKFDAIFHRPDLINHSHINSALKIHKPEEANSLEHVKLRAHAASHFNNTPDQIDAGLSDPHEAVKLASLRNPGVHSAHVVRATKDSSLNVRLEAAKHPMGNDESISNSLDDEDELVYTAGVKNENFKPHHFDKILNDDKFNRKTSSPLGLTVKHIAIENNFDKLEDRHLDTIFKKQPQSDRFAQIFALKSDKIKPHHFESIVDPENHHPSVVGDAVEHKNFPEHHLETILKDNRFNSYAKLSALGSKKINTRHLDIAAKDSSPDVAQAVLNHPERQDHHIDMVLNTTHFKEGEDKPTTSDAAKLHAVRKLPLKPHHITRALDKDQSMQVRGAAINRPDIQDHHILKALDDDNLAIIAMRHPNTKAHLLDATASHKNPKVRLETAFHPDVSQEHLSKLENDEHPVVREAAAKVKKEGFKNTKSLLPGYHDRLHMKTENTIGPILEIGNRWYEDYHDRALNASMKAKPENVKKSADILRTQLNKHADKAKFHQNIALELSKKYDAKVFKDIPDAHDRYRAVHHANMADFHRRKEAATYWAHSGVKKAAQQRGLLKDEPQKGHFANFKECANMAEEACDCAKGKPSKEIENLVGKAKLKTQKAKKALKKAKLIEERTFTKLYEKYGDNFYDNPKASYGIEHCKAEEEAAKAHRAYQTFKAIEEGLQKAFGQSLLMEMKKFR